MLSLPILIIAAVLFIVLFDTIPYILRARRRRLQNARNLASLNAHLRAAAAGHPAGRANR